ncbi:hypothetical protein K1719_047487 [Acacia pycnantha]|nr:hypothetical protein K1719_047487 [Acacia pycnantha]
MSLPRFVVLKSNYYNKYLRYIHEDVQVYGFLHFSGEEVNWQQWPISKCPLQYLQFASNDVGDDTTVGNEIFTTHDGSIRVKSDYFGKFWRRSPNWIQDDSNDTTNNNSDTLFWPVKVDNNVVALRNLGNNNFCKRLTTVPKARQVVLMLKFPPFPKRLK